MFGKLIKTKTIRAIPIVFLIGMTIGPAGQAFAEDAAVLARGQQLFELCAQCHAGNGGGNSKFLAPAIAGMPAWYVEMQLKNFKSGIRGLHAEDTGGLRMYPMSQWLRTEADQKAVSVYVAALPETDPTGELDGEGDASRGAGYYAVCSACHGAAGEGNQGMGAPPLEAVASHEEELSREEDTEDATDEWSCDTDELSRRAAT